MNLDIPKYNFNYNRPVIAYGNFSHTYQELPCHIDKSIVIKKFEMWDYVLKNNLLESENMTLRAKAYALLKDKTILAYAQLKFDDMPVKLTYMQDALMSDKSKRILFCGCNQYVGKSFSLNVDAATEFLIDHNQNWVGTLVSGSLDQSKYQMDRIKMLLKSSDIDYREEETIDTKTGKKDNATQLSYTFYSEDKKTPLYRNLLICCPHTSSALGYPVNNMWLDEFDFWENCDQDHFLFQIAIPRTFRTGGTIKVYTNPDGMEKMMHKLWTSEGKDGNPTWHRYHFNYWDSDGASQEGFDNSTVGMSRNRIESTILGIFTRTEGSFFSTNEIKDMRNDENLISKGDQAGFGKETVWFLDVGVVHDQSVLVGAYIEPNEEIPEIPLIKIFYIHKYPVGYPIARVLGLTDIPSDINPSFVINPEDGWGDYAEDNPSVKEVLEQYAEEVNGKKYHPLFGFDATGNAGLLPLCEAIGLDGFPITFSGKLKWHMYQRFQYYVQQRYINRANERDMNTVRGCDFDYQLSKLKVKKAQNQTYKTIHHENENDLDDVPDAVAGLIHLIENPDLPTLNFEIIPHNTLNEDGEVEQYIPSFIKKNELNGWINKKEKDYY